MLMLKAGGVDFEKSIIELDDEQAYAALTAISELSLMVRDGRAESANPRAAEMYKQFIDCGCDG
jgi:hypothetical protein